MANLILGWPKPGRTPHGRRRRRTCSPKFFHCRVFNDTGLARVDLSQDEKIFVDIAKGEASKLTLFDTADLYMDCEATITSSHAVAHTCRPTSPLAHLWSGIRQTWPSGPSL